MSQSGILAIRFFQWFPRSSAQIRISVSTISRIGAFWGMTRSTPGLITPEAMNDVSAPGIVRLSWLTTIRDSAAARSNVPGLDRVVLNYLDGFRCPVGQASWPVAGRKSRFAATTGRRPVPPKFTAGGPSPWRRSLQAGRLATPRRSRLKRRLRAILPAPRLMQTCD